VAFAARLLHQDPALAQAQPQADHQVALLQEDEVPCAAHRDQRVSQKDKMKQLLLSIIIIFGTDLFFFFRLGPGSDASAKTFPDETTQETVQADSESESGGNRDDHRCSSDDVPPPDTKSDFKKSKRATDEDSMTAKDVDPLLPTIKDVDPQRRFLAGAMRKRKRKAMPKEFAQLSSKHSDPDEQFLLSCLPALKRMTPRENATARMRIQQILFEVEFSTSQEQQFLTKEEDID
jgi:hypothetical protein